MPGRRVQAMGGGIITGLAVGAGTSTITQASSEGGLLLAGLAGGIGLGLMAMATLRD